MKWSLIRGVSQVGDYCTIDFDHWNFVVDDDRAFGSVKINHEIPLTSVSGTLYCLNRPNNNDLYITYISQASI